MRTHTSASRASISDIRWIHFGRYPDLNHPCYSRLVFSQNTEQMQTSTVLLLPTDSITQNIAINKVLSTTISAKVQTIQSNKRQNELAKAKRFTVPVPIAETLVDNRCLLSVNSFMASAQVFSGNDNPLWSDHNEWVKKENISYETLESKQKYNKSTIKRKSLD